MGDHEDISIGSVYKAKWSSMTVRAVVSASKHVLKRQLVKDLNGCLHQYVLLRESMSFCQGELLLMQTSAPVAANACRFALHTPSRWLLVTIR